ncbi:hypothetical protein Ddye_017079 [Dipteronia dyeriana]|uniref:DUF3511 domain protein n=1 Tax=Dipteronia dyeriana TaxID=168575 RepID=A0AAD9X154_9ROSI|nr:hypothetical protein Ddye_017079 [Dipteronia dyeriana]
MDGYGSGHRSYGGDRRLEIVSGKSFSSGFGSNQIYMTQYTNPDRGEAYPRATRPSHSASSSMRPWGFTDPEMRRKKRIAKYKVYTVEGNVKASLRKGLRWIKNKCSEIVHGH